MKKILYFCVILICLWIPSKAQQPENLTRIVLATVSNKDMVNDGEFQVELSKTADLRENSEFHWFTYVYTTKNKFIDKGDIVVNGSSLLRNRSMKVRTYRIAPQQDQCIFVLKNTDQNVDDIGYGMEVVRAYGVPHPLCDTVISLDDDGYIYRSENAYYYSAYKRIYDNKSVTFPVVWLERKVFDENLVNTNPKTVLTAEKKAALSRLSKGDVYYESPDGHYYYLYRDQYMPNTVLVVDDKVVELFGQYDEEHFRLRFSYDGKHWMAVGKECYWVDGEIKSVAGYSISDFVIANNGHYGYKAAKTDASERGEFVVVDGQVIRRNAEVCYFGLNAEGRLKFRFVAGGRTLQYENEKISDVSEELVSVYYPDNVLNDKPVTVHSNDGLHQLTYQKGQPWVEIDGLKQGFSAPCYAIYDERSNMFIWNAIENQNGNTELVIYKYAIVNNFFKKLFR